MVAKHANIKNAFIQLGSVLREYANDNNYHPKDNIASRFLVLLNHSIESTCKHNPWFIESHIKYAISSIGMALTENDLDTWLKPYSLNSEISSAIKKIGVIMAGNIPLVGFHDFLCVALSGHLFIGKTSSSDPYLLPAIAEIICNFEPALKSRIQFTTQGPIKADAVIATGSNNTARYFEHSYGKLPHIFRRNRNSIAVLDGNETGEELKNLATDIFMYFGLGCRSVSKLLIPAGFDVRMIMPSFSSFGYLKNHEPYFNNYRYQKSLAQINKQVFYDNGFTLLLQSDKFNSPVSLIYYDFYNSVKELLSLIDENTNHIQCIAARPNWPFRTVTFGNTQHPALNDYSDDIDTMQFLLDQRRQ